MTLSENSPLGTQLYPYQDILHPIEIPSDYNKILVEQTYMLAPEPIGTILRLPMVYGSNDPLMRFSPYLKRMNEGRPAIVLEEKIARWQGRYSYVENVAYAIALAVTDARAERRIYNVAGQLFERMGVRRFICQTTLRVGDSQGNLYFFGSTFVNLQEIYGN